MSEKKYVAEHLEVFVGKEHCFHNTTQVSLQTAYRGEEGKAYETVAEIWPTNGGIEQDKQIGQNIAAAVDACKDISTKALEEGVVTELLEVLKSLYYTIDASNGGEDYALNKLLDRCEAAIDKAKRG